jgi:hypothetical protein
MEKGTKWSATSSRRTHLRISAAQASRGDFLLSPGQVQGYDGVVGLWGRLSEVGQLLQRAWRWIPITNLLCDFGHVTRTL